MSHGETCGSSYIFKPRMKCKQCNNIITGRKYKLDLKNIAACSKVCKETYLEARKSLKLVKMMSTAKWKKKEHKKQLKATEDACNAYIRKRDGRICYTCRKVITGPVHAGHWLEKKRYPVYRFVEWNIHSQCFQCNRAYSGNLAPYTLRMIQEQGISFVEMMLAIEPTPHILEMYLLKSLEERYVRMFTELKN